MNSSNVERKPELEMVEDMERHDDGATQVGRDDVIHNKELLEEAFAAENHEHSMTMWQAAKSYPAACIWAFIMAFTIASPLPAALHAYVADLEVMESFDMFLIGNFVALPAFYNKYGVDQGDGKGYLIPTRWQTSLSQAGQIGAFLGVFMAPPITNRLGYRWTALIGLMLMNATIFISFFADSLPVFLIGQLFEGIPWGFFISMSPAYWYVRHEQLQKVHQKVADKQLGNRTHPSARSGDCHTPNVLGDWQYHRWCRDLLTQQAHRRVGVSYPARHSMDISNTTYDPHLVRPRIAMVARPPRTP